MSTTTYDLGSGRTHTREKGDLLHPTHEPAEVLRDIKKNMGSMQFSAQYQQAPEPAGGKIIKRKMLKYYSSVERRPTDRIVMSWDIALSEQEAGHYSACVVLLNRGDSYFVLEVIRGKFTFDRLKDKIIEVKQRYGKASLVIEESPISHGLIQSLQEKHINVVDIKPGRDKQSRLMVCKSLNQLKYLICSSSRAENSQFRAAKTKDSDPVKVPARCKSRLRASLGI